MRPVRPFDRPRVFGEHVLADKDDANLPAGDPDSTHKMTGVDKLHAAGLFGKGVKIGIIDTGVDYTHPNLGASSCHRDVPSHLTERAQVASSDLATRSRAATTLSATRITAQTTPSATTTPSTSAPATVPTSPASSARTQETSTTFLVRRRANFPCPRSHRTPTGVAYEAELRSYRCVVSIENFCHAAQSMQHLRLHRLDLRRPHHRCSACRVQRRQPCVRVLPARTHLADFRALGSISLSLGGADGWTESAASVVASRIVRKGRVITIAAGNDGEYGGWFTSSPGNGLDVISVASVDNTEAVYNSIKVAGVEHAGIVSTFVVPDLFMC